MACGCPTYCGQWPKEVRVLPFRADGCPHEWQELVRRCLQRDPQHRPAIGEVLQVLCRLNAQSIGEHSTRAMTRDRTVS